MPREAQTDGAHLAPMIDPVSTALVVIDVQVDFAAPSGAMARVGCDLSDVPEVIEKIQRLILAARNAGAPVVFARVVTRPETDSPALKRLYERKGHPDGAHAICRADDAGSDYYAVRPHAGDIEIEKTQFSSFVGTDLEDRLRSRGVESLVMAGLTTDCCVDCTARDAFHRGFDCFIVEDACSAYDAGLHASSLRGLAKNCALLVKADAVEGAWAALDA